MDVCDREHIFYLFCIPFQGIDDVDKFDIY